MESMCKIILTRVVVSDEINNRRGLYEIGGIVNAYNNMYYAVCTGSTKS